MAEQELEKERKRSPNYPSISLESAVAKVYAIYEQDGANAGTPSLWADHWETSIKSSSFLQTLSSLRQYGLIAEVQGVPRKIKLTKDALDIVMLPPSDPKHIGAIKRAALAPKLFRSLWSQYGAERVSDANLIHQLVTSLEFRNDTAADAIKQYKKNIEFAKLSEGDKIPESDANDRPELGDFVQWVHDGTDWFDSPMRVSMVNGEWVYVEGSATPIHVDQTRVESKGNFMSAGPTGAQGPMGTMPIAPTGPTGPSGGPSMRPSPAMSESHQTPIGQKDFPLYLSNNQRAVLYIPSTMTPKDYQLLKRQIDSHMAIIEATAVSKESTSE